MFPETLLIFLEKPHLNCYYQKLLKKKREKEGQRNRQKQTFESNKLGDMGIGLWSPHKEKFLIKFFDFLVSL